MDLRCKSFGINALIALPTNSASHPQVYFRHPSLTSKIYIERLPGMKHYKGIDLNVITKKILIDNPSKEDKERELKLTACTHHLHFFLLHLHVCFAKIAPNPHPSVYAYWTLVTVFPHIRSRDIIFLFHFYAKVTDHKCAVIIRTEYYSREGLT